MGQLDGKVALVTGFGSGLGRAIAVSFAREGCAVAGTSTTLSKGEETLGLVRAEGGAAVFKAADVRRHDEMKGRGGGRGGALRRPRYRGPQRRGPHQRRG